MYKSTNWIAVEEEERRADDWLEHFVVKANGCVKENDKKVDGSNDRKGKTTDNEDCEPINACVCVHSLQHIQALSNSHIIYCRRCKICIPIVGFHVITIAKLLDSRPRR